MFQLPTKYRIRVRSHTYPAECALLPACLQNPSQYMNKTQALLQHFFPLWNCPSASPRAGLPLQLVKLVHRERITNGHFCREAAECNTTRSHSKHSTEWATRKDGPTTSCCLTKRDVVTSVSVDIRIRYTSLYRALFKRSLIFCCLLNNQITRNSIYWAETMESNMKLEVM